MARYTVELRELLKDPQTKAAIDLALSTYPMYVPAVNDPEVQAIIPTREELNKKLLNHYKYREIGFETAGRFIDELEITMNEIMPYYNQMYNSVEIMALIDDPFGNVDVTETFKETHGSTSTSKDKSNSTNDSTDTRVGTNKGTSYNKTLDSETPKGNLDKTAQDIDSVTHADNASWSKNDSNDNSTSAGTNKSTGTSNSVSNSHTAGTVEHTFTKKGNQGVNTYAHDMIEFRTSIIDVTMKIIEDHRIKELFMMVY